MHGDERDADGLVVPHARDERATRRGRARRRRRERDAVDPRLVRRGKSATGASEGGGARVRVAAEPVGLGPGPQVVLQRGEIPRGQLPVRRPRERDRREGAPGTPVERHPEDGDGERRSGVVTQGRGEAPPARWAAPPRARPRRRAASPPPPPPPPPPPDSSSANAATEPSDDAASATHAADESARFEPVRSESEDAAEPRSEGRGSFIAGTYAVTSMYLWSEATEARRPPQPFVHSAWPGLAAPPRAAASVARSSHAPDRSPGAGAADRDQRTRHAWITSFAPAVMRR